MTRPLTAEEWREIEAQSRIPGIRAASPETAPDPTEDRINYPKHYTSHPSGVECIQITEHMTFCAGNAIKYLWRAGLKGNDSGDGDTRTKHLEDLEKAKWYVQREIDRLSLVNNDPHR